MTTYYEDTDTTMGDLIRFPDPRQQPSSAEVAVDGTAAAQPAAESDELAADESGASGQLVPDTSSRAVERSGRRPLLSPELKTKAKDAGAEAWTRTRRHSAIVLKGVEQQRQQRKAERDQADMKAARRRAAEQGDYAQVREINKQMLESRVVSIDALRQRVDLIWAITKKALVALIFVIGVAVVAGLINTVGHWLGPWSALDVLYLLGMVIASAFYTARFVVANWLWLAPAALGVVTAVWLSRRWRDGRNLGEHVLPVELRTGDSVNHVDLDESALVTALANIGLPPLKDAVKQGWPNRETDRAWVQFPILDGNGITARLRLPLGAPVEKVGKAKVTLAHNLGCLPAELWVDKDRDDPTVMDLFRLNPGELRKPVPEYPLLHEGSTNYFSGFPVGISPRGQEITGVTSERNYVISGIMGSGKTTLVLNLLAGAVLDPLVDIDVFCFAENNDYDAFKPCFDTFVMGDSEDNVQACQDHISALHADLAHRGELLRKHGVNKVNREVAAKEPGLRPRIVVIDECQAYFRQDKPEDRRAVVNGIVRFFSAARKYGITCVFVTPIPSDQSLPRDLVSVTTNRACYAIGDKTRNNVVLGEKAHENGISALGLKPATEDELNDVGTSITIGFTDVDGTVLRSYYLDDQQQRQVAQRAVELRDGTAAQHGIEERDLLADTLAVMGSEKTRAGDVVKALAARWTHYQGWKIKDLVAALAVEGVTVPKTRNEWPIDPTTVRDALAGRDATDDTTEPGNE